MSYRNFKNFDEAKFIEDLQTFPWDTIKLFDDSDNGSMDLFISTDRR